MITCKITISETVEGISILMEPDNRDGSVGELALSKLMDIAFKEFMNSMQRKVESYGLDGSVIRLEDAACDLAKDIMKKHFRH